MLAQIYFGLCYPVQMRFEFVNGRVAHGAKKFADFSGFVTMVDEQTFRGWRAAADRATIVLLRFFLLVPFLGHSIVPFQHGTTVVDRQLLRSFFANPRRIFPIRSTNLFAVGSLPSIHLIALAHRVSLDPSTPVLALAISASGFDSELQLLFGRSELRDVFLYLAVGADLDLIFHTSNISGMNNIV